MNLALTTTAGLLSPGSMLASVRLVGVSCALRLRLGEGVVSSSLLRFRGERSLQELFGGVLGTAVECEVTTWWLQFYISKAYTYKTYTKRLSYL